MTNRRISPLSIRILLIMLLPLILFFIGILALDRYRIVLIDAELNALKRQGETLARSLALANADSTNKINSLDFSERGLAKAALRHILPLVGYGTSLRARIYQPSGRIMADTANNEIPDSLVQMSVKSRASPLLRIKQQIITSISKFSNFVNGVEALPMIPTRKLISINQLPALENAMMGKKVSMSWRTSSGQLVLGVALPIQEVRVVRGALLLTKNGAAIEAEIAKVQWAFFLLLCAIFLITVMLGLYLSRSITRPIVKLALSARKITRSHDKSIKLEKLPNRNDEIGELSKALQEMTNDLQERIRATAGFAADVAHELKNPLTSLRSAAETISRIDNQTQQQALMGVILEDVKRLDRLINDISQASRVEAELAGTKRETVNFCELVDNWVLMMKDRHSDVELAWNPPANSKFKKYFEVSIHSGRVIQILDNMLLNAISFNPPDKNIEIKLAFANRSKNMLCFSIRDFGIGIPEANLDTIFNRFYTQRPGNEAFGHHSGLGLSIARQIAEAHDGRLYAMNGKENGAIFTLELPLTSSG